jgi:hypothetical protein
MSTVEETISNNRSTTPTEQDRRERLKKAGEAYFERILQQKTSSTTATTGTAGGKDSTSWPHKQSNNNNAFLPVTTNDAEAFEAVGLLVESARPAVLGTLYVASNAISLVFLKASLTTIDAPAFISFLHFAPVVVALLLLSSQGVISPLRRITATSLKGAAPSAAIELIQVFLLLSALSRCSVFLALTWTATLPTIACTAVEFKVNGTRPSPPKLASMATSIAVIALALFSEPSFDAITLFTLVLWAISQVALSSWHLLQQRFDLAPTLLTPPGAALLGPCLEEEQSLDPPSLLLMRNVLLLVPSVVLGLLLGEVSDVMEEIEGVSVPAAGKVLVSMAAWVVAAVSGTMVAMGGGGGGGGGSNSSPLRAVLNGAAPLGTVVTETAVHGVNNPVGFVAGLAAAVVGLVMRIV